MGEGDGDFAQRLNSSILFRISSVFSLISKPLSHNDKIIEVKQRLYYSSSEFLKALSISINCYY